MSAAEASAEVIAAICRQLAERATKHTVDVEWGRAVQWAFAERAVQLPINEADLEPLPTELSHAQRAVLGTLVSNDELWDRRFGNAMLAFRRVQLPYDRDAIRVLLGEHVEPPSRWTRLNRRLFG